MDQDIHAIKEALVQYPPSGVDRWFIDCFVIPHVTPANVQEVFKLLSEHDGLNHAFWSTINNAPITEEGWNSLMFIGSDMNEALQEKWRLELRRAVEVVRTALGPVQVLRNQLFRPRR